MTDPSEDANAIMPLKVGNTWIHRVSDYDSTGVLTSTHLDTTVITSDELIHNEHWFRNNDSVLRTNRSDGSWVSIDGFDSWLALKYPAAVSDTFHTDQHQTGWNGATAVKFITYMMVTSTDTVITVPAGTFHCYAYEFMGKMLDGSPLPDSLRSTERYFCSLGTGLIKSESSTGRIIGGGVGADSRRIQELVEARLK